MATKSGVWKITRLAGKVSGFVRYAPRPSRPENEFVGFVDAPLGWGFGCGLGFMISETVSTSRLARLLSQGGVQGSRQMRIQALRALGASLEEAAVGSVPSISSFVMASSGSVDTSSSPTGGRFLFGASGVLDELLFGRELGELAVIADWVCPSLKGNRRDYSEQAGNSK